MFNPEQQQLATTCDDDTTSLLRDCYLLEEKERLKEEWSLFKEQKKNFERERRSFTEAAIRLGLEVSSQRRCFGLLGPARLCRHLLSVTRHLTGVGSA